MEKHDPWRPIATAPLNKWVEVMGESRMAHGIPFIAVAKHCSDFRPLSPWRDIQMSALSDNGWTPAYWRPLQESTFPPSNMRPV